MGCFDGRELVSFADREETGNRPFGKQQGGLKSQNISQKGASNGQV